MSERAGSLVKRIVLAALAILLLVIAVFAYRYYVDTMAHAEEVLYESALSALVGDSHYELKMHRRQHGVYPSTLRELEYDKHSDQFCDAMFEDLIYWTDGTNYTLEVSAERRGIEGYRKWMKEGY